MKCEGSSWFKAVGEAYPAWNKKQQRLSWWTRFRLWFKPCHVALDFEGNPNLITTAVHYKWLGSKVYITGEELLPPLLMRDFCGEFEAKEDKPCKD